MFCIAARRAVILFEYKMVTPLIEMSVNPTPCWSGNCIDSNKTKAMWAKVQEYKIL